jgi:S-DNA-T family DNA segregation ATPase FtsK/SpoIIIE
MIKMLGNSIYCAGKDVCKMFRKDGVYDWDYIFKELKLCNNSYLYPILYKSNITDILNMYLFTIPPGLSIKNFTKYENEFKQFLKVDNIKIELVNNLLSIKTYNLENIKYNYEDYEFNNEFKVPLGVDLDSFKPVFWKPSDPSQAHLLIGGSTGGGKSVALNVILTHLIKTRKDIQLYLQDTKMVDLYCFKEAKQVNYYGDGTNGIEEVLLKLSSEMERRYKLIRNARFKDINGYRTINRIPYIFLVIEELATFNPKLDKEFYNKLAELLAKGRGCGIYVIITTQAPYAEVLPGMLKNNINVTLGLKAKTMEASKVICGSDELVNLKGKGHGILYCPEKNYEIQCFNISESYIESVINAKRKNSK